MKRFISVLLVAVLALSMVACTKPQSEDSREPYDYTNCVWNLEGTMFPLEKTAHFEILTSGYLCAELSGIAECKDWLDLCAACNVEIEFVDLGGFDTEEAGTNLQMRLANDEYGDAIICVNMKNLTAEDINSLASSGLIVALNDYMNDETIMPNFKKEVLEEQSYLLRGMRSGDGNIYSFYGVAGAALYKSCESLMQVNSEWLKAWKEARGVDYSPKTMEEFEDMLKFFYESDFNGNGIKDEIPYMICQNTFNGTASLEASMGMFGIGNKDSNADMDIMIDDEGNCYYIYTQDNFKEALKVFSGWYSKGYIWDQIFTGNGETIANTISSMNFGVINCCYDLGGYEPILPPTAEGYEARYHIHPACRSGLSSQPFGVITNKCEQPEVLAAFFDLLYDFENYLTWRYGSHVWTDGSIVTNEEGKYVFNTPVNPLSDTPNSERAIYDFIWHIENFSQKNLAKCDVTSLLGTGVSVVGAQMYQEAGLWNPTENLWPRCAILSEYADDYAIMYTDVKSVVAEYRAKFLTGKLDIDAEWNNFQSKIEKLGVKKMQDIIQKTYDAYLNN